MTAAYLGKRVGLNGELRREGLLLQQMSTQPDQSVPFNILGHLVTGQRKQDIIGAHTNQHLVHSTHTQHQQQYSE